MYSFEYRISNTKLNELKNFIERCNKEIGGVDTIHVDMLPGTTQSPFTLIRYTYDTGKKDDYGKVIKGMKFMVMLDSEITGGYGVNQIGYFKPDNEIYIHTDKISLRLYGVEDVNKYFIEKYLSDMKMALLDLGIIDKKHKNDYNVMSVMIKEIEKE